MGSGRAIALSHLRAFKSDSERYLKIYQPTGKFQKFQYVVEESLTALRVFNVEQQTAYVLALLRAYDERKIAYRTLRRALVCVENFHFQFNAVTSQRSSGTIASMYARAARSLHESGNSNEAGEVIRSVTLELRGRRPSFEEFAIQFRSISYSAQNRSNALVRYILLKLAASKNLQFDTEPSRLTIEHIFPQSGLAIGWSDELLNSLGNLVLLSDVRNQHLKNKPYAEKHALFQSWGPGIPAFVRHQADWTPEVVNLRIQEMAEKAYNKVWNI